MDSSCEQKKMKVGIDRLSNLPEGLIHKILSFIGTKHVVQTSALSSKWRYTWTSMPYLDFSSDYFAKLPMFSKFVTRVLSNRNNEVQVSSLKLRFRGRVSQAFVKKVVNYAVSHNVQHMAVTCLLQKDIEFPLSLFNSPSVKHLSLTTECCRGSDDGFNINPTLTWQLPSLTTLYLENVTLSDDNMKMDIGIFSKCPNLKNITLKYYDTTSSNCFTICHPQLSNLTLKYGSWFVKVVNVVAPQLENLTIMNCYEHCHFRVSAPNLTSLVYKGHDPLHLNTDGFPALEKANLHVSNTHSAKSATGIMCLFKQLQSVKYLTLSLEIFEVLASSDELVSRQPSPFSNLNSVVIYAKDVFGSLSSKEKVTMFSEVKSYLLNSNSPSATFTMVFREEFLAPMLMAELQVLLDKEKVNLRVFQSKEIQSVSHYFKFLLLPLKH